MKKHTRLIISTLCVGVLLFAGFILGVNLYVQSTTIQTRIRNALTEAVGMPVNVFRTTFSPWGGFRLDQIKIAADSSGKHPDFLNADVLEVRCQFIPLLKGRIVLKRIALDSPQFVFQKNASGQYRLPRQTAENPMAIVGLPSPASGVATTSKAESTFKPSSAELDIRKLLLRNGSIRFLAEDGGELLQLEGVRCSLNSTLASDIFTGDLEIKRAVILNRFEAFELESSVKLQNGNLEIEKIIGEMADGHLDGSASADLRSEGKPYHLKIRLDKAQLGKLVSQDSELTKGLTGLLNFRLEYAGFATEEAKNRGSAELKITSAKIAQLPILQMIGQISRSSEFENLSVKKTEIKADFSGSHTTISSSSLQSEHLQIYFSGPIDAQQKMDLKAQLVLDDNLFKKLPSEAKENFSKYRSLNQQALDFDITGTLSAPHTNLVNRLIGDKLQKKFKGFLSSFGGDGEPPNPTPAE